MMTKKAPLKLFISHPWDAANRKRTQALMSLLEKSGDDFQYQNSAPIASNAIDSSDEYYLRRKLRERIRASDILIFVAAMYVSKSRWIKFEIQTALTYGKPVLAVKPMNAKRSPRIISELGVTQCAWRADSIIKKIRQLCYHPPKNGPSIQAGREALEPAGDVFRSAFEQRPVTPPYRPLWAPVKEILNRNERWRDAARTED